MMQLFWIGGCIGIGWAVVDAAFGRSVSTAYAVLFIVIGIALVIGA